MGGVLWRLQSFLGNPSFAYCAENRYVFCFMGDESQRTSSAGEVCASLELPDSPESDVPVAQATLDPSKNSPYPKQARASAERSDLRWASGVLDFGTMGNVCEIPGPTHRPLLEVADADTQHGAGTGGGG